MIKRFFILLLAIVASVGMSFAQDPGVVSSGTKGGMSYTFYDNGLLEISGSGALPGSAFTNWNDGFGASVKNIRFAEDCEVYGLDYMWFACYTQKSQLETIEINSVTPIMFSGSSGAGITYKQDGAVTITITAPGIVDIENKIIRNYGSPVNMILNMPATTVFEKKWFSSLENYFAVTIPTGAKGHIPGGYSFTNPYDQQDYDHFVEMGHEADFWEYNGDRLVEGVDYTLGVESTFVITAENASQIFGQATVSFQAPTEASNSEWVLWRKSDLKTFSDMSSGDQKVYKDVTVKVNNGVYNTDSGFGIHFDSSDEDGVQFVAPEGKVFKRIVILNEYGTFSDPNWSYDGNYKKWSGSANTVGFEGDICGISLIEFEVEGSAPAAPAYETVMNLIDAIGTVELTAECKAKIDAARTAYNDLSAADKELVTNIATLTQAETDYAALNQAEADKVIAKINEIPTPVTLKLATRDSIESARAAFEALNADQKLLVSNIDVLEAAEAELATLNPGGGMSAGALSGKFSINADGDQISFAKGNLQATTTDLGETWTWGFAANQWDLIGNAAANNAISGNGTVSANGTVDLFGWSTPTTHYGIHNSTNSDYYSSDFREWGENITGAEWKTLRPSDWIYIISNRADAAQKHGQATVNGVNGYIFLPDEWELPTGLSFTAKPNNWTANVYDGDDWTAMENAGAVFLPKSPWRSGNTINTITYGYYWSSDYNNYSNAMAYYFKEDLSITGTGTPRYAGICVRLITAGGASPTPLDSAQAVKDLIEAIPAEITLEDACVNAVQAARDAYNALTEATKDALDEATVNKLNQAITDYTALIQAGADAVTAKIAAIPQPVTLKLATRDSIQNARAAYDALTADQKALVSNYAILEAAEATWAGLINVAPAGALSGKYTINAGGDFIYFAHGNLQYTRENLDADWSTGTFRLAENQYDMIEEKASPYCTDNYGDKTAVGLFGWSTWGEGKTPNLTSSTLADYTWSTDFVGTLEGTSTWRTLTKDEWVYLLTNHNMTYATVHGVHGLLIAPDGVDFDQKDMTSWNVVISDDDWTNMQNDGVVFLPACGQRSQLSATAPIKTSGQGEEVLYYSSTEYDANKAYNIWYEIGSDPINDDYSSKRQAFGVRLVSAGVNPLDQVQVVKGLIDAIPAEITLDAACVNAIQAARAGYDALDNDAKAILDAADVKKLTDAEAALTALNQAEADKVIAKINNIPTPVELKLATRDSIQNARAAYDALNAYQKPMVTNYQILLDAEAALADLNPGVPPATPLDSAQHVKDLIDAIPTPVEYPTSGAAIAAALNAYDALSDAAKGALDAADVQKLNDAATQYPALEAIAAIEAIPAEIVYDPLVKAAIETARDKYDALSVASKALVDDEVVAKLTNAEKAWADLVALIEHNVSYIGKDGELKHETVALLHIPNPAPDFNGYEFVRWDVKAGDFLEEGLRIKAVYTPIITTNPQGFDTLVYNGTAQTLITAGVAKEGHIEYRINDGEWSAELPQATFAAAYVVYYKLVREGHADYIADPINVTIAKAPVAYTAPTAVENLVYTASNQTLIAAGQTNDGTFEYSLDPTLLDSWKAELPQAKDADTYSVYYRVQGDLNHLDSVAATPVAVTIAKAELTATADDKNVIYGDAVPAYTVTYAGWQGDDDETVLTGELAFACEYASTSNVGEYTITPSGVSAANYDITFVDGKVTVAKAVLMITAEDKNVIYGDAVPEYTATYSGWKNSDGASVVSGLIYTCEYAPTSNVGTYDIVPSGATATNYTISYTNGKVTVAKAELMITAEDKNVTYGDAVPEYTATYSGWKNTDDASVVSGLIYTCEYAPTSNVGEYTIVPSGATATNYNISYTNGKVTVAKAALMITADDKNVIYGDAVPEYTATYSGWKNSDDASVVSNLAYTCEYAPTSNVGEYTIVPSGATATNYNISYTNGKVTVAQATLTVTADDKSVTYGDAAPAFTATYSGWKNTDDASVVSGLTLTSEYLVTSNVGTYDIVPANATALNYAFVYVNGTLTVNQAALMITADDKSVEYGEVAPAFTASYSGWKNTDDKSVVSGLTLTSEYLVTSNVGTYDIVPANATATNYAISYTNGTLTVNQAPLMITADDKSVIYGDEHPEFTASYSGWKNTDDKSVVSGLTLTSEYLVTSNVGTYDIVPANATATNYAISYTNGTLTVNQAALTITAENKEMIYGDEHPEFTASYSGWKNSDDESVVSGLAYTTPYAPGSPIGTYTINPNSATALNYAIAFVDGTLTVNKAHVYVSGAEVHTAKFADGHANAEVTKQGTLNGIKLSDPIAHVTTAAFSSADVAEHLTITLFYELTGDDALLKNYNLDPTSEIFSTEGVIIEPFIPNNDHQPEEEEQVEVKEGIDVYAYGYCDGSGYSLKYHLNSGNPDQYKIDFADSRFTDVDWTNLVTTGKDGTIDIDIPVDLPTGDYTMTVYFRDSRFDWLESQQFNVTFHVNLPETFIRPLFDNVIALVDTCNCLTDIQWYWRANSSDPWEPIPGATGYYYHVDGKLTGEYFVKANMNGEPTYTCGQSDMETLYGETQKAQAPVVKAYPNPVVNTTTVAIEYNGSFPEGDKNSLEWNHNLRIVNLMGVEVMNTTFEGNETSVEMSGYPQGNYMISVDGIVVKVMKQ